MFALFACLALFLSGAMILAWRTALATNESGRIDAIWSLSTGLAMVTAALAPGVEGDIGRSLMVAAFAAIWSLRLGAYMWRRAKGHDDPRYAALKKEWGAAAPKKLYLFLQAQALASWPLVLAAFVAAHSLRGALDLRDALAAVLFLAAFAGATLADSQMARFRADPANRGRVCDVGLWAWSRHPNYFFEWAAWLAYPLVAIASGYPAGWLALGAPALMYYLLVYVSGLPPLEAHMARSRPEAFRRYAERVNAFWPRPPRP
jgi:steroid 5-alpha reductase family enzyme